MLETKIVAVLNDLFFTVKINESAKRAGVPITFVKSEADVLSQAAQKPALIIFDLNYSGVDALGMVRKLKTGAETKAINVIGYLSHVQGDLKQAAHDAGFDMVLARSAFSQNLPQILKRHSAS